MKEFRIKILLPEIIYRMGVWTLLFYRKFRYGCAFRIIELTQGLRAIVDPEDYERLTTFNWFASQSTRTWYAQSSAVLDSVSGKRRHISMHREVMRLSNGEVFGVFNDRFVDHQNHNGLDNRHSNLRSATRAQNTWNRRKTSSLCSSRFKGVCWSKKEKKWHVQIKQNRKQKTIGYFDDEQAAAKAYDSKAKELFGRFAALNFPENQNDPLAKWTFRICYGKFTG